MRKVHLCAVALLVFVSLVLSYLSVTYLPLKYRDAKAFEATSCTLLQKKAIEDAAHSRHVIASALSRTSSKEKCFHVDKLHDMIHVEFYPDLVDKDRFDVEVWVLGKWMSSACDSELEEFAARLSDELRDVYNSNLER